MNNPTRLALIAGAIAFLLGLALGKDQGDAETARNTASAILLTLGFLVVVVTVVLATVRKLRTR